MNIVISSAMLAVAILMVAHSIYELGPQHINEKEKTGKAKKAGQKGPGKGTNILGPDHGRDEAAQASGTGG